MIDETLLEAEEKMEKAVAVAKEEFAVIRTGRAHPAMFAKITAEYYGTPTPVNQLASFHIPEPRMVVIQPFDKSSLAAIEKAIRNIRRHAKDSLDKLIKTGDAGEDEVHRAERELDDLTHTYVGQVDDLLRHKEAELLEV